jgi:hypothetical protein
MINRLLAGVSLLACFGCAAPTITSRIVDSRASGFIRLDTFADTRTAGDLRYDHPADWSEAELTTILSRLLVRERVGLLDQQPSPQPLFSSNEIRQLVPGLQRAFVMAKPSEWVAFYSTLPAGDLQEFTSGGLFLKGNRLHVVVANHREQAPSGREGLDAIRAIPLRPLGGRGFTVSFDPARYVSATKSNWMGGSSTTPASELILDYQAFLADALPPAPAPVATAPVASAPAMKAPPVVPQAGPTDESATSLKDRMTSLQNEVERLRRRVEEQDDEIAHLKTRLTELDMLMKNPPK